MISNCSFLKLLKEDARRSIWLFLLSAYLYLTYIMDFTLAQSGQTLFIGDDRLGPGNNTVFLITISLAIACAIQGFSYLFSEEKTDFYFSLPVRRKQLFFANYLNGLFISGLPCILSRLICYFIEGSRSKDALYVTWMGILLNILGFLLIYHLVLCVILLTGHILIAASGTMLLFIYGTFAFGLVLEKYNSAFFDTYYKMDFMNALAVYTSPYRLYGTLCGTDSPDDLEIWLLIPHLRELMVILAIIIFTFIFAYSLFQKRPAEAAGHALAFENAKTIMKCILAIPTVLAIGYYIMLCSPSGRSFFLLAIGIVFAAFTLNGLLEIVFRFDIRGMLAGKIHFVIITVVCLLTAGSFSADIWGYDNYIPKGEEIQSAAVAIHGLDDATYSENTSYSFQNFDIDNQLSSMQLKGREKENLLAWISEIREHSNNHKKPLTYVAVAYHMKDNKTIYRKYPIISVKDIESFQTIYESESYKKGAFPAMNHDSPGTKHYIWSNGIQSFHLDLTEEENAKLMKLIATDLTNLKISDLEQYFPIGTLSLVYGTSAYGEEVPLYPTFDNTIRYLEEIGIPAKKSISDYEISRIQIYERHKEIHTFGKVSLSRILVLDTTDYDTIRRIARQMIPEGYAVNPILNPVNTGYETLISYKDSSGRTIQYANMNFIGIIEE